EIRKIHADDEENESDSAPEDNQRAAQLAGYVVLERGHVTGVLLEPLGMRGLELREQNVGLRLRLGHRDAGLEAPKHHHRVSPIAHVIHDSWDEDIGLKAGPENRRKVEGGWKHANDSRGMVIESQSLTDDGGI